MRETEKEKIIISPNKPMASMKTGNFGKPTENRSFPHGKLELVKIGSDAFGRATFEPGWKWSNDVKPIAKTESCKDAHVNLHLAGRLMVVMDDGTKREFGPGDIAIVPPGHDAWVVGDEPAVFIDIAGAEHYAQRA
jgi:hypothetical protein